MSGAWDGGVEDPDGGHVHVEAGFVGVGHGEFEEKEFGGGGGEAVVGCCVGAVGVAWFRVCGETGGVGVDYCFGVVGEEMEPRQARWR